MADSPVIDTSDFDFSHLTACFVNCTLKPSPTLSHTQGLMDRSKHIMAARGVQIDEFRAVDYDIAPGIYPDMTEDVLGGNQKSDGWPALGKRILDADILVLGTPIWLGEKSSVATRVIERLYGMSGGLNARGQYLYYGRAAGVLTTGNDDGSKHISMNVLYSLQHLGYTIPPNADAGWTGEAGPGPSYLDESSGALSNEFTQRNTTFMAWNLMHMASMLKAGGGFPAGGNSRADWDIGARFDHPNPEYR